MSQWALLAGAIGSALATLAGTFYAGRRLSKWDGSDTDEALEVAKWLGGSIVMGICCLIIGAWTIYAVFKG